MFEVPIDIDDIDHFNEGCDGGLDSCADEEGIVVVKQGIILNSNDAMVRLSGYRHEEVVDTIFASFFHLDDIPAVESICDPKQKDASGEPQRIVRLIGKNGQPIPVQISAGPNANDQAPVHRIKIRHI